MGLIIAFHGVLMAGINYWQVVVLCSLLTSPGSLSKECCNVVLCCCHFKCISYTFINSVGRCNSSNVLLWQCINIDDLDSYCIDGTLSCMYFGACLIDKMRVNSQAPCLSTPIETSLTSQVSAQFQVELEQNLAQLLGHPLSAVASLSF